MEIRKISYGTQKNIPKSESFFYFQYRTIHSVSFVLNVKETLIVSLESFTSFGCVGFAY